MRIYFGVALVLSLTWLAAKLWPHSIFHRWEQFFTNNIEMPALMLSFALAPFVFVAALVRTAREKAAEDRERFRIARGQCPSCGNEMTNIAGVCPHCAAAIS
jgi:hypothetical protein